MFNRIPALVSFVGYALLSMSAAFADESVEKVALSTFKIFHKDSTATGLLVKNGEATYLVTANHVFDKIKDPTILLVGRKKNPDQAQFQRKDLSVTIRSVDGKPLWKKHPKLDLAVLLLPKELTAKEELTALPVSALATAEDAKGIHTGDVVFAAVFPERDEANGAGFPIIRKGAIASYPIVPIASHTQFLIDMTAFGGDSGGPVIHSEMKRGDGGPVVMGFVLGQRWTKETIQESKNVQRIIRHPLGIAYAVHSAFVLEVIAEMEK
jgi:hypothetical protein